MDVYLSHRGGYLIEWVDISVGLEYFSGWIYI